MRVKNVQTTPPVPTASTVGFCPTVIQIEGRSGTGSLPRPSIVLLKNLCFVHCVFTIYTNQIRSDRFGRISWALKSSKGTSGTDRIRTQSLSQTSKGKMDKHILTNNRITDYELATLSQTGCYSVTFTELNELDTQKC